MADIDKPKGQDSGGDVSLSVDETNKLRAQLGLKPLEMEVKEEKAGSNKNPLDYLAMKEEEEERKKTDELQRKIEEMKKQRKVASKVMAVKGLGEASDGEDDIDNAAKWVKRSRKKHQALADKLAKQLQEQEEQDAEQAKQAEEYSAANLAGFKVAHDDDDFKEGETVILTLADQRVYHRNKGESVINEEEDELENVNMAEFSKTQVAKERAKRKKLYDGTDDSEFADGGASEKKLLARYDDFVVDGKRLGDESGSKKSTGLRLGDQGMVDLNKQQQQELVRKKLQAAATGKVLVSLEAEKKMMADYQTTEEVAQFKKSSGKVRKLRKKTKEKLVLEPLEDGAQDHGVREDRNMTRKREEDEAADKDRRAKGYENAMRKATEASAAMRAEAEGMDLDQEEAPVQVKQEEGFAVSHEEAPVVEVEDDEDDRELALSLARARRAKLEKKKSEGLDVAKLVESRSIVKQEDDEEESRGQGIVFTTTTEFCRNLQGQDERRAGKAAASAAAASKRAMVEETEEMELDKKPGSGKAAAWENKSMDVKMEGEDGEGSEEEDDGAAYRDSQPKANTNIAAGGALESEALASRSVSDALKLMRQKGLKKEVLAGRTRDERLDETAEHWADKMYAGAVPEHLKKEITIQRLDEFGRQMTTKEAWRKLNHNFHGKKPGARKVEKRKKQYEEEMRMKKINSGEMAVEQMEKVSKLQAKTGQAYMSLSGGAASTIVTAGAHLMRD